VGPELIQLLLTLAVAETPAGKEVTVLIIRKGKEETKTVTIGRLED
jgi:serine protease Do